MITELQLQSFFSALTAALITVNLFLQKRIAQRAVQARHAARVRLSEVVAMLTKIQADGNGALGNVLRLYATAQRRVFKETKKLDDLKLAEIAEARAAAHEQLQAEIEARRVQASLEFDRLREDSKE